MSNVKGRGITVAIAATYSAAKTISAITQANPGAATSTSHGLADATVGYLSGISGMVQLEDQAIRVDNPTTNSFEMQGLNTTNMTAFSGTCSFTPVATWATLGEATSYSIGGGSSEKLDVTTLLDTVRQEELGLLPVQNVTMNVIAQDTPSTAMALLETAVQGQTKVTVRITFANGAVRIFRAEPSLPGEDVQQGAIGTGSLEFAVKGLVLKLAA